ncbi:MAG TPA: 23S rRNA (uracil(1939)-C(5))-methyltransferase RlmD [Candidatus Aquilonibacter sp.]|nr:23S rRNA (uracil(1939)-C(5))-methyltransferase RlmD [Candidatus Aquilonibacter sp.]
MEVKIEKLVYGGEGLAHHQGSTVFAPYVLPGETVSATPFETKKKFVRAALERVIAPSAQRIAAPCPYFSVCGGCDYQHIPYEQQLKYKAEILRETLRRLGRVEWAGEIVTRGSPAYGYRNRAQWKIRARDKDAAGSKRAYDIGYFRANSTAMCAVDRCPIVSPLLERSLRTLQVALAAGELPRELREIEAFANTTDTKLLLTATFAGFPAHADEQAAKLRALIPEIESLVFHDPGRERMELEGPGFITCEAAGETFRVGHFSFFQVNRFLVDDMVRTAVGEESGNAAWDLYAGVGLFSLPLARRFSRVIAVESNPAAASDLEQNASRAAGIIVRTTEAERAIERMKEKVDLIVLDPPRAGLAQGAAARLTKLGANRITYVSCEPPTLARDLAAILQGGYAIRSIDLFDLFPQTFHMETIVKLERGA